MTTPSTSPRCAGLRSGQTAVLLLALAASTAACQGLVDPSKLKPTDVATPEIFCQTALDAIANLEVQCSGEPRAYVLSNFDPSACPGWQRSAELGRMNFDSRAAQGCVDLIRNASCTSLFQSNSDFQTTCMAALEGTVPVGGDCREVENYGADECLAGAYCDLSGNTCPGTCAALAQAGESCMTARCADGLHCDSTGTASVCNVPGTVGSRCGGPTDPSCDWSLYCDTVKLQCEPYTIVPEGGMCGTTGTQCATGLWCNNAATTPTCQARQTSGGCTGDYQCADGYVCAGYDPSLSASGNCSPINHEGDGCRVGYNECVQGTYCTPVSDPSRGQPGTCVLYPSAGGSCGTVNGERNVECIGSYCAYPTSTATLGTCAPFQATGASCSSWDACGREASCNGYTSTSAGTCVSYCIE